MAGFTVISEMSMHLHGLLRAGLESATGVDFGAPTTVSLDSPGAILDNGAGGAEPIHLSLYLYRVAPNPHLQNWPLVPHGPGEQRYPPLQLDLFYLLTPLVGTPTDDLEVLGRAMQLLDANATIREAFLDSDLRPNDPEVRVLFNPVSIEELTRIWSAFNQPYQLSVCYRVQGLAVDSARQPQTGAPVVEGILDVQLLEKSDAVTRSRALAVQSLVTGRVIDSLTGSAPRVAVTLRLLDRDDPDLGDYPLFQKVTADGRFSFFGDPATAFPRIATGEYRLRVEAAADHFGSVGIDIDLGPSAGQPSTQLIDIPGQEAAPVTLFSGNGLPVELADLVIAPESVALDGRVINRVTGEPVGGASVELVGGATVPADADGRFTYAALPVEAYATFDVVAAGFEPVHVVHLIAYGRARNVLVVPLMEEAQ